MVSLDVCPVEVANQILGHLKKCDLRQCCLVSKGWQFFAEPALYTTLEIEWTRKEDTRFVTLVRSIILRPALAQHARSLILRGRNFCIDNGLNRDRWPRRLPLPADDADTLAAFVGQLGVSFHNSWQQGLRQGTVDALLALLLSQLPKLSRLYLEPNWDGETYLLGRMLRRSLFESTSKGLPCGRFQHLEDISFGIGYDRCVFWGSKLRMANTLDLLLLFYLPSIRELAMPLDYLPTSEMQWPSTVAPSPRTIKSMHLDFVRAHDLETILSATSGLESFRWTCHLAGKRSDDILRVHLDQVAVAVSNVRRTLTDLSLETDVSFVGGLLEEQMIEMTGSLRGLVSMDRIKTIRASLILLAGGIGPQANSHLRIADAIPRNVEQVTVTDDQSLNPNWAWTESWTVRPYLDALQAWMDVWHECTPRLRRVTLIHRNIWEDFNSSLDSGSHELYEMFAQAGVALRVVEDVDEKEPYGTVAQYYQSL